MHLPPPGCRPDHSDCCRGHLPQSAHLSSWALATSSATAGLGAPRSKAQTARDHPGQGQDRPILRGKKGKLSSPSHVPVLLPASAPPCSLRLGPWTSSTASPGSSAASQTHPHPQDQNPHWNQVSRRLLCIVTFQKARSEPQANDQVYGLFASTPSGRKSLLMPDLRGRSIAGTRTSVDGKRGHAEVRRQSQRRHPVGLAASARPGLREGLEKRACSHSAK